MEVITRTATAEEKAKPYRDLNIFQIQMRREACLEISAGFVEEISFSVSRAWKLFTCDGSPCCPNQWLLQSKTGSFVQVDSWQYLSPTESGDFPGTEVLIVRWPVTFRVLSAKVAGDPIKPQEVSTQAFVGLPSSYIQCLVSSAEELPESVRAITAG